MSEPVETQEGEVRVRRLVDGGADLAGAIAGVGAAAFAGPFVGAAVGVAIKQAVAAVGSAFSRREEERIGAAILTIADDAQAHQERGERPRDDGFFDARGAVRPDAEEL